jgi:ATP-dependent Clp protease ATP-binding subunit ClpC
MAVARYPLLITRDAADGYSATTIDGGSVGFGKTASDAKEDLKNFLLWHHKKYPYSDGPDFQDPQLTWFQVPVRPEYRTKERTYPTESTIPIKVICITGQRASGQPAADLPTLGIRFDYPRPEELRGLVHRYVAQRLEGLSPQDLISFFPPQFVELSNLTIRIPKPSKGDVSQKAPPTLGRIAEAMGDRALRKGFARAWGREAELSALVKKLHKEKANVLLLGEPGVGKTTLLVDTVREVEKLVQRQDPDSPWKRRYWLTSAGRIVAGMKYLGQWEERVEDLIGELGEINGVLCVDRLLDLIRRGGTGPTDSIASFIAPYLSRGELRMVAEVTPAELEACRRLMPSLPDLFQIVPVMPFDRATALTVIDRQLETTASGAMIDIERGTGERVVRLFRRFMPYTVFPGAASGFARELVEVQRRQGKKQVSPEDVLTRFQQRTGLPKLLLRDELTLERADVLSWFQKRVIDQPEACESATDVVMSLKAGLNDPARPPAVLLFCGPTGVGKTHMAQAIAEYLFGQGEDQLKKRPGEQPRLIRLDMSEFGGFDAVYRLLGPPQGEPAELIRRVRREPFCVVLLDEVEKAATPVFDTLMGLFDEGRLTDQYGRVTNFRSAVVIMTSNLGAGRGGSLGFGPAQSVRYRDVAMQYFRPEFFNRMDAVVTFEPLRPSAVQAITRRELQAIEQRDGIARLGLKINWSDRLIEHLAQIGFDPRYGARPLQRAIEQQIVAPLAKWLLEHAPGGQIEADWREGFCLEEK